MMSKFQVYSAVLYTDYLLVIASTGFWTCSCSSRILAKLIIRTMRWVSWCHKPLSQALGSYSSCCSAVHWTLWWEYAKAKFFHNAFAEPCRALSHFSHHAWCILRLIKFLHVLSIILTSLFFHLPRHKPLLILPKLDNGLNFHFFLTFHHQELSSQEKYQKPGIAPENYRKTKTCLILKSDKKIVWSSNHAPCMHAQENVSSPDVLSR